MHSSAVCGQEEINLTGKSDHWKVRFKGIRPTDQPLEECSDQQFFCAARLENSDPWGLPQNVYPPRRHAKRKGTQYYHGGVC